MDFSNEFEALCSLTKSLREAKDLGKREAVLLSTLRSRKMVSEDILKPFFLDSIDLALKVAFYSIVAIGQAEHVFAYPNKKPPKEKIFALLEKLVAIDNFYESIGGIVGYHTKVLQLLKERQNSRTEVHYSRAEGIDLVQPSVEVDKAVLEGVCSLPEMGEIYPIGGLGSRLNLRSKWGEPLPAACLPFCGYTLLEGLVRDIQAREFLYYRLFHKQVTIPIAMMTSYEKQNAKRVWEICENNNWFERPKESFFLFSQLSVPVISVQGQWVMCAPLKLLLQPGGHGALWRTAEQKGVFSWFQKQAKNRLLIRQINNPLGGVDRGLLALVGIGKQRDKTFGFASCERLPYSAEGVLVLKEDKERLHLSNIEYTNFEQYGIKDHSEKGGYSAYPANTNILYADLKKLQPVIKQTPLLGLIINMKNKVFSYSSDGTTREVLGGRLESMMQNISDALSVKKGEPLPTFLTHNHRGHTLSSAKQSFELGKKLIETPEGAFYDLLLANHALLRDVCEVSLLDFCSKSTYLEKGPSHLFLYHPALGPLYRLIRQKIRKGKIADGFELQLEIADIILDECDLSGSLHIQAQNVLGHCSNGIRNYGQQTGKCILQRVCVKNRGINRAASNCYWRNQIERNEVLTLILKGHSEFYAEDITFSGSQTIVVPDGERWIASQDRLGMITYKKEKANWEWSYQRSRNHLHLLAPTSKS